MLYDNKRWAIPEIKPVEKSKHYEWVMDWHFKSACVAFGLITTYIWAAGPCEVGMIPFIISGAVIGFAARDLTP